MTVSILLRHRLRFSAISMIVMAAAALASPQVLAQSRRDQAAVEQLQRTLQDAQHRYRQAGEGTPQAQAALRDADKVIADCATRKGCNVSAFLLQYRSMLQPAGGSAVDDDVNGDDPIDFTADDIPPEATADALLDERNRAFAQAVQFNPAVQSGIRRWLTDMRPSLMQSYENYQYMRHLMAPAFHNRGLPEALLFGILAKESNGKVHVGSRAGAVGPLQFMPATGKRFGLGPDGTGFDTRYDPRASAEAAASYLMERYGQLNSNIELSLAAYNGGEGRALRVFNNVGSNFWNYDVYNQFPAETKDYVPMVIAAAWLYLHPQDYGLQFPRVASRPALLRLEQPTTLYELTICLGNTTGSDGYLRALRNLNPRFEPGSRLPQGGVLNATTQIARRYNRYCTGGKRSQLAQQLVNTDPSLAIVRVGDVTSVQTLVPQTRTVHVPGQGPTEVTGVTGQPAAPTDASVAANPPQSPAANKPTQHRVAAGETLMAVARRYGCTVTRLAEANGIRPPRYAIRPGQVLRLDGCAGR